MHGRPADFASKNEEMLHDLNHRAHMGLYAHSAVWILVVFLGGLVDTNPFYSLFVAALFLLHLTIRIAVRPFWIAIVNSDAKKARTYIYILLLCPAFQWGLLAAISAIWIPVNLIETPLLLMMCSLASVGTSLFGISTFIRFAYPVAMLGPMILVTAVNLKPSNHLLMGLLVLFIFYLHGVGKRTNRDYRTAQEDKRAVAAYAKQLQGLSTTDALTELHNRYYFDSSFGKIWLDAKSSARFVSILLIDIDFFKRINDMYGHPFGDECLKRVASALRCVSHRSTDVVARYGGEEFAIILVDSDNKAAEKIASRVLEAIQEIQIFHERSRVTLSCSIGVSSIIPTSTLDRSYLIQIADKALYDAKNFGRNRYCYKNLDDFSQISSL